jgi:rhodanese-related sulfurtransferase
LKGDLDGKEEDQEEDDEAQVLDVRQARPQRAHVPGVAHAPVHAVEEEAGREEETREGRDEEARVQGQHSA